MKACKIILIGILALKSISRIIEALNCDEDQLENIIKALVVVPIAWLLYWGAGLLDF